MCLQIALFRWPVPRGSTAGGLAVGRRIVELRADLDAPGQRDRRSRCRGGATTCSIATDPLPLHEIGRARSKLNRKTNAMHSWKICLRGDVVCRNGIWSIGHSALQVRMWFAGSEMHEQPPDQYTTDSAVLTGYRFRQSAGGLFVALNSSQHT